MLIYAIFHCLRLRYRESKASKSKTKCINLVMVSYLIIISSILTRSFAFFVFSASSSFHSSLFPNDDCTYFVMILIESMIITKFGIHLFVMLRFRIAETDATKISIWFKIVCCSLFLSNCCSPIFWILSFMCFQIYLEFNTWICISIINRVYFY